MRFPGRQPKDRKKKNEKKNNAGDASLSDMSEDRKQNMGQEYHSMTSAGDPGSIKTEGTKPALTVCIQISDRTADLFIPVTLGDICLEGREEENAEKPSGNTLCTQGKMQQQMEEPESVLFLEPEMENIEGAISEGVLLEEGKGHLVTPGKENRQCGRPELLNALLQGTTYEKELKETENDVMFKLEAVPSEAEMKKDQLDVPFQELQQSREPALSSTLAANQNKPDEEHNADINSEGENSFQDQRSVLCNDTLGLHELILDLTFKVDRQVTQSPMMSVYEGDAQNKDEEHQDMSNEKMKQAIEPGCPDLSSTTCGNHEWLEQQNLDSVTQASSSKVEHPYLNFLEQKDPPPVTPKAVNFPFLATTHEKTQEEVKTIKRSSSDICLSKAEDHQCRPYQEDQQVAAPKNMPVFPTGLQNLAHTNFLPDDIAVHFTDQKHTEQQLLLEETGGCCYSGTDEQETQSPIETEDINIHPDNISHEKEQQRKLECGDSEPEGIYDKKDQDHQGTVYLEMQQPSVFAEPLRTIPGEDQCVRKEDMNPGQGEIHLLDEESTETEDQCNIHILASSKEKVAMQQHQKQQPIMPTQEGCNKEEKQPESWLFQKGTSLPSEEQLIREQMNVAMACEAQQKEIQGLSGITFLCNTREQEEQEEGPL